MIKTGSGALKNTCSGGLSESTRVSTASLVAIGSTGNPRRLGRFAACSQIWS